MSTPRRIRVTLLWEPVDILLALGAAFLYAVASVLQQREAESLPDEHSLRLRLMLELLRRPIWLAGYAADWLAFGMQAAALSVGSLIVVQPLIVTGLLFALPIGATWSGRHLTRVDVLWALILTGSLAVFLLVGAPTGGVDQASTGAWLLCAAVLAPFVLVALIAGIRAHGAARAVTFAAVTGVLYGVTAALTKTSVNLLGDGVGTFLTNWEPYALAAAASVGMLVNQSAFQAGSLTASLPTLTIVEPIVAAIIGVTLMQEELEASGAAAWTAIALAVVGMVVAAGALARSAAKLEADLASVTHLAAP